MNAHQVEAALTFAAVAPTLLVAHTVADHWVQSDAQACGKGRPGWAGRRACLAHVVSYTATTAAAVVLVAVLLALPVSVLGVAAGQLVSAVTHYVADRRRPLAVLAELLGKSCFYRLGTPREGRDDNSSLGTGAYALDQSYHQLWLLVAALITALTITGPAVGA